MIDRYTYYVLDEDKKKAVLSMVRDILVDKGASLIIIFGSFIELDSFRDIDIAVYFKKKIDLSDLLKLEVDLENTLGYPVDIIPLDEVPPRFRLHILRKGLVLYEEPGIYESLLIQSVDELELTENLYP